MKPVQNYTHLFKYFIFLNPRAFVILLLVAVADSFISTITIVSVAPFADYLSDPTLAKTNEITKKIIIVLDYLNANPSLVLFGTLFILSNIFKSASEIAVKFVTTKIKYSLIRRINTSLVSVLLQASWSHWKNFSKGKLLNTLTRETTIVGDLMGVICTQIAQTIKFVVLISFPFLLFPTFMSALVAVLAGLMLPYLLTQKLSQRLGIESTRTSNESMAKLYEIIRSIRPIKSFLQEKFIVDDYEQALSAHFAAATKAHTISFAIFTSYQTVGIAAIIITTLMHETLLISEMAMIIWSMIQALPLVGRVLASNAIIATGVASFHQLMNTKQNAMLAKEKFDGKEISHIDKIVVQNVSYSSEDSKIIDKLNIEFCRGTISALAGKSGSGKTTLAEMIGGFTQPSRGKIYFGTVETKDLNVRSLRKRISYCSQETLLIPGSVFDNLAFAKPDISINDAMRALEFADGSEFVKNLPDGINTYLGDNSGFLSGGERQKLSLARSFLCQPDIYIFDEITASIDKTSEKKIYQNISQLKDNAIVIFITHNIHALKIADQIHFIENGKLGGSGTFEDLAESVVGFQDFIRASEIKD